ncbi:MAG: deoxyribodipyrimidine photo-lyase [Bacteroidota bacterium]
MSKINCFWFRRDLRLHDNAGLYHALKSENPVLPLFIFDKNILDDLEEKSDARVHFLHDTLHSIQSEMEEMGSSLVVKYGTPEEVWEEVLKEYDVEKVFTNHDFEPYALERDKNVKSLLEDKQIEFHTFKDHVIFEKDEVLKDDGTPYTVFTPYSKKWKAKLASQLSEVENGKGEVSEISYYFKSYDTEAYFDNFYQTAAKDIPSLESMGFSPSDIEIPSATVTRGLIRTYDETRNFPAKNGTSRLGVHFRFGTISIREKARAAKKLNETFLNELIWRDFYAMILSHFPHVVGNPFRAKYDNIEWRDSEEDFQKWCDGKTGYHIVDAGMRELNATGYMHNSVRMITASFLTKHLLLDWRWGEAYFAKKLLDFDLASNNGGWQWAAGCGTDAAPYFRIFNPDSQQKKFDKDMKYIKKWVPEYGTSDYVERMVDHKFARERCLSTFKEGLAKAEA